MSTAVQAAAAFEAFPVLAAHDLVRFLDKIDVRSADDCWEWTGGTFSTGYPAFWLKGNNVGGHRVACALAHGLSAGRMALHSCDNPPCCNPAHLRWGTPADNMDDRSIRGRAPLGETHPHSTLTAESVREIRSRRSAGEGLRVIGETYGITAQAVHRIVTGRTWGHIA